MADIGKSVTAIVLGMIVLALLALALGGKPKPCPPHICLPPDKLVSTAEYIEMRKVQVKLDAEAREKALAAK